jgi:hypothetical protein
MKKIIRLTESDLIRLVKRVIKEQPLGGLLDMPETGQDVVGLTQYQYQTGGCKTFREKKEFVLDLFIGLRKVSGQSDKTIQSWVQRIHNILSQVGGSDDLRKVFNEIKTQQQMGSVLLAYNKKFGKPMYQDLSEKLTISWDTVWDMVKKFKTGIKIKTCKEYYPIPTSSV